MKAKIAFITPRPYHAIYQDRLVYDELLKRGWKLQYNQINDKTTHLFCTCASQFERTTAVFIKYKIPYITWIPDIIEPNPDKFRRYMEHIRNAWKAIAICEKQRWLAIEHSGRYRIDLVRPCIDNHTIKAVLENRPRKKDQIVVVGALNHIKKPYLPFLAWKELPEPKPDLIFLTYGTLNEPLKPNHTYEDKLIVPDYDTSTMSIKGLFFPQLDYEATIINDKSKSGKVKFIVANDKAKFKIIAESKLLVMADDVGGFNLPPIEAWYCNTPALVSDDHSYSDFGDDMYYYNSNDIGDLKENMIALLKDGFVVPSNRMPQYTIEKCCDRLEQKFLEWGLTK